MSEVIVLVPVLRRPQNVAPLVESFAKSDTPGQLLFLVDLDDEREIRAIEAAGQGYRIAPRQSWPCKINYGYRATSEPWLLCAADDVNFHSGWFQATKPLRDSGYSVIGTNDLGNPRVLRGEHSTHTLVRRSYADEFGTLDGPAAIVHEGYRHWCVDDELVATAKARGALAFCREAIVEHRHPYWGAAKWDDTYALGESRAREDLALWAERRKLLACMNPSSPSLDPTPARSAHPS